MGSVSDFTEKETLDHVLKTGSYTPGTSIYLALSTADVLDDESGLAEPGSNYARKLISFGNAAGRVITQDADVDFDQATGSWGDITHWALYDASSGGNFLAHGAFSATFPVGINDTPTVVSGEVNVTVTAGGMSNYLAPLFLDWMFNGGTLAVPGALWVGLTENATLSDTTTGTDADELEMTNYGRVNLDTWNAAVGTTPALADNNGVISFGALTGTAETVTGLIICDAETVSNILFYSNTPNQLVNDGNTVSIPDGGFDVTMA